MTLSQEYQEYRKRVREATHRSLLTIPRSRGNSDFHVDHIVPISKGFALGIPPEQIGSRSNLRTLKADDNYDKGSRLDSSAHEKLREWGYE